jgi:ribonucleotide monophosphatase NagD (HAD superfamily)
MGQLRAGRQLVETRRFACSDLWICVAAIAACPVATATFRRHCHAGDIKMAASPGLVRLSAERLGARRAVMTGDTPYDAEAARAAGVSGLGVLTGGFREHALTDAGCFAVVREVGEMREALASPEAASQVAMSPLPTPGLL